MVDSYLHPAVEALVHGIDERRPVLEVHVEGSLGHARLRDHHVHADASQAVLLRERGPGVEQRLACLQRAGSPSSVTHRPEYMPAGT